MAWNITIDEKTLGMPGQFVPAGYPDADAPDMFNLDNSYTGGKFTLANYSVAFGELTTDFSDPFKLLNMLVYILGEEYLNNSDTLTNELWNIYIPQEKFQVIIDELKGE